MLEVFSSPEWSHRLAQLGVDPNHWRRQSLFGLSVLRPCFSELTDYERWPSLAPPPSLKADLIIYRKLFPEQRPHQLPPGSVVWRDSTTYRLKLTEPPKLKPELLRQLGRTERKLAREIALPQIIEADDSNKRDWFEHWSLQVRLRYPNAALFGEQNDLFIKRWILDAPLEPWIKLYTLRAGNVDLAWTLGYVWGQTFYNFLPTMSSNPTLAKYGPGKLLTHMLVQRARQNGLQCFDFLHGEHAYKVHWGPEETPLMACMIPVSPLGKIASKLFGLKKMLS